MSVPVVHGFAGATGESKAAGDDPAVSIPLDALGPGSAGDLYIAILTHSQDTASIGISGMTALWAEQGDNTPAGAVSGAWVRVYYRWYNGSEPANFGPTGDTIHRTIRLQMFVISGARRDATPTATAAWVRSTPSVDLVIPSVATPVANSLLLIGFGSATYYNANPTINNSCTFLQAETDSPEWPGWINWAAWRKTQVAPTSTPAFTIDRANEQPPTAGVISPAVMAALVVIQPFETASGSITARSATSTGTAKRVHTVVSSPSIQARSATSTGLVASRRTVSGVNTINGATMIGNVGGVRALRPPGLYLDAVAGSASMPDPGPLPAEYTLVAKVQGPTTAATAHTIAAQYEADPQRSWLFRRSGTTGALMITHSPGGTSAGGISKTVTAEPTTSAIVEYLALSTRFSDGAGNSQVTALTSKDGVTWVAGAASPITPATSAFDSNGVVRIGRYGASGEIFQGKIFWVELRSGPSPTGGSVIWRFDPKYHGTGPTWVDGQGHVWTLTNNDAVIHAIQARSATATGTARYPHPYVKGLPFGKVRLGAVAVNRMYVGHTQVWP